MMDMTKREAETMQAHGACWKRLAEAGTAIAFGPVADPKRGWGVGILAVTDDDEARRLQNGDPAIRESLGMKYEAYPMPTLIVGCRRQQAASS